MVDTQCQDGTDEVPYPARRYIMMAVISASLSHWACPRNSLRAVLSLEVEARPRGSERRRELTEANVKL